MADSTATDLQTLTAQIVSGYLTRNAVLPADLPVLIGTTAQALQGLGKAPEPVGERPAPAVSIRRSVTPDAIVCLECGYRGKMLRRHLESAHGLSADAYKARWGLPHDYPLTSPAYSAERSRMALSLGLGKKSAGRRRKAAAVEVEAAPLPTKKPRTRKTG